MMQLRFVKVYNQRIRQELKFGEMSRMKKDRDLKQYDDLLANKLQPLVETKLKEKTANVLDVGCGAGTFLSELRQKMNRKSWLVGLSITKENKNKDFQQVVAPFEFLPANLHGLFDYVFSVRTLEYALLPEFGLLNIYGALGEGGVALIQWDDCHSFEGMLDLPAKLETQLRLAYPEFIAPRAFALLKRFTGLDYEQLEKLTSFYSKSNLALLSLLRGLDGVEQLGGRVEVHNGSSNTQAGTDFRFVITMQKT